MLQTFVLIVCSGRNRRSTLESIVDAFSRLRCSRSVKLIDRRCRSPVEQFNHSRLITEVQARLAEAVAAGALIKSSRM